jgi:hypothetical protein
MPYTDRAGPTDPTVTGYRDHETSPCAGCGQPDQRRSWCPTCTTCDRCQNLVPRTDTVDTVAGSTICNPCWVWYWQCQSCAGWNEVDDSCDNGCCDPDSCDCEDCRSDSFGRLVYDYGYKPDPVFHGTGPLFLGPELELEAPYGRGPECAEIAQAHLGSLGYLKEDSSLSYGFEIVTHPMSYDWALANYPWTMLTRLADAGCVTTEGTGLHVHVSRAGFASPCHTYRWMKFIYRNQIQVTTLARRSSAEWAAFTDSDRQAVKDYAKGARLLGDRHRAINPNNPDTFELRVFASSLDPGDVKAALGFTAASVEYTRTLTANTIATGGGWTWPAFVAWLAQRPAYRPVTEQLEALQCVC